MPEIATPTEQATPPAATARATTTLALAVFMSSLDLFIVNLAFPSIARDHPGTSLGTLSWVLDAYTIVFAAVLVPAGRWADRVGRRRVLVAGLATFAAGSLACGVAPSVGLLVAARVVQAVGAGMMVPASLSLLLAVVPPGAPRVQAIGTWSAVAALGAAVGPVVGGLLVQASWRWVFWINLPVAAAAVGLSLRWLPESREPERSARPDVVGAGLLAGAVALLAWALVEAPTWGWASAGVALTVAGALVALAALARRSAAHPAPVVDPGLLRSRRFDGAFAAQVLYSAGFGAFVLSSVEFLTGIWHYSPVRAGLAIGPGPLMVLPFARVVAPRLAARLGGPSRVAALGCAVGVAAQALWLARIQAHPAYLTHLLPSQLVGGAGVGLTLPSLLAAGSATLPPDRFGTGSGVLNMGRQVGTVLGVAALVAILTGGSGIGPFRDGLELVIGFFVAAGATALVVAR